MPNTTRGTIRASKGFAIFRILLGLFFIGLSFEIHFFFNLAIGLLFLVYGLIAFFYGKTVGTRIELETTSTPSATDRLAEILKLKNDGLISEAEYEQKRQEILKDL